MMLPFELRFTASYISDIISKDNYCLDKLKKILDSLFHDSDFSDNKHDLTQQSNRSAIILALALLEPNQDETAEFIFRILLSMSTVFHDLPKSSEVVDEMLLLFTLAKHHPAFGFDQRIALMNLYSRVVQFLLSSVYALEAGHITTAAKIELESVSSSSVLEDAVDVASSPSVRSFVDSAVQTDITLKDNVFGGQAHTRSKDFLSELSFIAGQSVSIAAYPFGLPRQQPQTVSALYPESALEIRQKITRVELPTPDHSWPFPGFSFGGLSKL
ncbi:unnamed protein product [Soboliphyme baturini]|uniref:DUF3453 domain-containing protein n=1 Tax=Soboliphyme baturini TaxID=241478 RepID=A0A183IV52_9BILA|nr:unnamed protein product [Soboliphyme baturini]